MWQTNDIQCVRIFILFKTGIALKVLKEMRLNRQFLSCCEPHYESEAKCKVVVMKISFHS